MFHGWRNGVMVMKHNDGTLSRCLTGWRSTDRARATPHAMADDGHELGLCDAALSRRRGVSHVRKVQADRLPGKANEDSVKSRGKLDNRLPAEERVIGTTWSARTSPQAIASPTWNTWASTRR